MSAQNEPLHEICIAPVRRNDQHAQKVADLLSSYGRSDYVGPIMPASTAFMRSFFPREGHALNESGMMLPGDWQDKKERIAIAGFRHKKLVSAALLKPDAQASHFGFLNLATDPAQRGQGYASTIVLAGLYLTRLAGYDQARVMSAVERPGAKAFWQRRNFEERGEMIEGSNLVISPGTRRFMRNPSPLPSITDGLIGCLREAQAQAASESRHLSASE